MWPFNRDIFTDADFSASFVTDRPMPNDTDLNEHLNKNEHSSSPGLSTSKEKKITNEKLENVAIPFTSAENSSEKIHFRPEQIRPYPKAAARVKKVTKRRKIKSTILTSSPMKKILQEEIRKEMKRQRRKALLMFPKINLLPALLNPDANLENVKNLWPVQTIKKMKAVCA